MNLAHLSYFTKLAETKSYRETAQAVAVSQSTLSTAISGLEREIGATLFVRKKGSVELTAEGEIFLDYVHTSLKYLEDGINLVREQTGNHIKEITVGAVNTAQSQQWSELIYEFRKETHGDVQINVTQGPTETILDLLRRGEVDVAFCGRLGDETGLDFHPCWTQEATLVINKNHPLAEADELSLDDLDEHYLISYRHEGPIGAELTQLVGERNLNIDYLYGDEITLGSIVAANPDIIAIACKSWLLDAFTNETNLVPIAEASHDFHQLYFCHRTNVTNPLVVEDFVALAKRLYPARS